MRHLGIIIAFIFCTWLIPSSISAQFTETKVISKRFQVTPETRIEIANKYGKIELNTWDKDSVVFEIGIRVEERNLSRLEKSFDAIDFDFTHHANFLIARTQVEKSKSVLGKELQRLKETVLQSEGNIVIDIEVWLPNSNDLKVENKFGDIFIGDYLGKVEIDLSNGNLKSHNFNGRLDLRLNFADATINSIESAYLDCNFSDIYIKKAGSLQINSKSTKYEILEIGELDADSRRDNFRIRKANLLEARGSFSNFRMNELTNSLNLRVSYGDIDVESAAVDFSSILIEARAADINLYFHNNSEFDFEISHTKTELELCDKIEVLNESIPGENEDKVKLTGFFGKKSEKGTRLIINAGSGEVNIFSN